MKTEVTLLLSKIDDGDLDAVDKLLPLLYDDLRRVAARKLMDERAGHTLQATALVHEAYLRLVGARNQLKWNSRGHFFAAAAEAMRRILVDHARKKKSQKRGGEFERVGIPDAIVADSYPSKKLLAMDDALATLEKTDAQKAEVVKLRFFAGLSVAQSAEALEISVATAERHWAYARSWLQKEMKAGD